MRMLKYLVLNLVFPLIEPVEECFWDYAVAACVKVLSLLLVTCSSTVSILLSS